jgi:PBP1b-binding outer membrane lipoprotein LpoB
MRDKKTRFGSVLVFTISGTLVLSGCSATSSEDMSPSQTPTQQTQSPAVEAPKPTSSSTSLYVPASNGNQLTCESFFTAEELYNYNPNIALIPDTSAVSSEIIGTSTSLGATKCQLLNLSTNTAIDVFILKLTPASASEVAKELVSSGGTTSSQLTSGMFEDNGEIRLQEFIYSDFWVIMASTGAVDSNQFNELIGILGPL